MRPACLSHIRLLDEIRTRLMSILRGDEILYPSLFKKNLHMFHDERTSRVDTKTIAFDNVLDLWM